MPRPGRPRRPDATPDQRERLLDAALSCFVRDGIAPTTLRGIAQSAGVTPAMLHYYFGDKPQLLEAVVAQRLLPALGELHAPLRQAGDDLRVLMRGFVAAVFAGVERHPWLPTLWVREVLSEGGALRALLIERIAPLLPRAMAQRFAAAQARGQLNPDLDPRLLVVSLIGLTLFPLAAQPVWQQIFNDPDLGREALQGHCLALLERGLELPNETG